ncbi:DUF4339 domain-containing protein [Limisphaera sp. VF-2]|jgi:hypothetical protein|uniref:DUF4339 domain-containing protein n=1 Tax=Limisphaera sp. VF-2 TaxID=3400418 RepID=UPI00175B8728
MYRIIGQDGREYGPVPRDTLLQWIRENRVGPQTPVLPEGETQWRVVGHLPEFASALSGSSPAAPPPLSAYPRPTVAPQTLRTLALVSFASGVLAWILCCCCYGAPLNVVAVVLGSVVLYLGHGDPGTSGARAWALAGVILGALSVLFWMVASVATPWLISICPGLHCRVVP